MDRQREAERMPRRELAAISGWCYACRMFHSPSTTWALLLLSSVAQAQSDAGVPSDAHAIELPAQPNGTAADRLHWLHQKIEQTLARRSLAEARIGISVAEIDGGRTVYHRNEEALYNPASNVKLITTAAALALLGPEFRFKTTLLAESVVRGEVTGSLYLQGRGDPSLVTEDLWKMAGDLAAAGVRKINGDLAIDDRYFDEIRVGPGFAMKSEDLPFRAPNGAVSLNYNACSVHVLAGAKDGAPARVLAEPASPYLVVVNHTRTVTEGKTKLTIAAHDREALTELEVEGQIRKGDPPQVEHRRIGHPDLYMAHSFREVLARRGIKVGGQIVRAATPPAARPLVTHFSSPLGVLVRDVNKLSNNFMAEQVLKTLGAETGGTPGTWPKGIAAIGRFLLERLGLRGDQYQMTNGSGLYDSNRFSPAQIVQLLRTAYHDFRFAADFVGSLSLAGADGTIGHRMNGSSAQRYVRAKTGTLEGVSCLSGYAGAPGRVPLAFSVLMNQVPESAVGDARRAQDEIAEALVTYLQAP